VSAFLYTASDSRLYDQYDLHQRITDVFPTGTAKAGPQVAVVSWEGDGIDALAILRPGARVANYKQRITIDEFEVFDEPITTDELAQGLNDHLEYARFSRSILAAVGSHGQLTEKAADALRATLEHLRPGAGTVWEELEQLAKGGLAALWTNDAEPIVAYERDAVGLALGAAGFTRSEQLRGWRGDAETPFLTGLRELRVTEDAIIDYDAGVFGDWEPISEHLVGIVRFEQGDRRLTVVNANRNDIEKNLGVDLLYYSHNYEAYVLVQYKRLRKGDETWEFRPSQDRNFEPELQRMREIAEPGEDGGDPDEHRLGGNFCFVKFCKPSTSATARTAKGELSGGMYLPLDYLDKLLATDRLKGPRDGVTIRYDRVGRWMTNGDFEAIVRNAWVGSRGLSTEEITKVARRSLDANHSIVMAAAKTPAAPAA
jgi:hypothetical protein